MKSVAMTLSALRHPLVVLMLIGGAVGCFYLWTPLFHVYMGIVALNMLNVVIRLVGGALFRGLAVTRAELAAAMAELREEDAREKELSRKSLEAAKAKLRGEVPESYSGPQLVVIKSVTPESEGDEKSEPKLRIINGGKK